MNSVYPLPYQQSVFINCPFDDGWKDKFYAIVFTVQVCNFIPRCYWERNNSDDVRIEKIMEIIEQCQYAIHDVSKRNGRLNMPLELGLFMGCKRYGLPETHASKSYLIFEGRGYSSKLSLSDLAGQDVKTHHNQIEHILQGVRDWLDDKIDRRNFPDFIPSGHYLKEYYEQFTNVLPILCADNRWSVSTLKFKEYMSFAGPWINAVIYPKSVPPSEVNIDA